jgi:class 3 adenylate cyclase
MGIRTDQGEEVVIGPNHVFDLPPGHVTWVEGDEELVMVDWAGGAGFDMQPGEGVRVMATILFTDIVDSTVHARMEGDAAWKHTVAMHEDVVRTVLPRFGGREVETAGDSFLIVFDGAERAIRCGLELVDALAAIRLSIRVGIHSGEVTLSGKRVRGVAVHVAARILAEAGSGEVLLSGTTRDLAEGGAGLAFESRGGYRLKGLEREHELFGTLPVERSVPHADPGCSDVRKGLRCARPSRTGSGATPRADHRSVRTQVGSSPARRGCPA